VFGYRRGGTYGRGILRFAAQWAAFGLVYGLIVRADNAAHVGGLAGGVALAFLVPPERQEISVFWNTAGIIAASLVALAFIFPIRAAL
jgi:rhomboid protease GluP